MKQHAVAIDAKIQITVNRNHNLSAIKQFRHQRFNSNYNLQQFNNNSSTILQSTIKHSSPAKIVSFCNLGAKKDVAALRKPLMTAFSEKVCTIKENFYLCKFNV